MGSLHISISAETLFHLGPIPVSNSILTSLVVTTILITLAIIAKNTIKYTKKPQGLQNVLEVIIEALLGLVNDITHNPKKTASFFPFIATFFLFIWLNNWLGLLPGVGTIGILEKESESPSTHESSVLVKPAYASSEEEVVAETTEESKSKFVPIFRAGTADLNTTLALALISVFMTQFFGVKYLGLSYFEKFLNFKQGPIYTFVGFLEIISEIAKIISFAFRLFGNVFAGEVLLAVIAFIVPIIAPLPFIGLEIFVGLIQALVFAMLTLVFMSMATTSHSVDH